MLRKSEDLPERQMPKHSRLLLVRVPTGIHRLAGRNILHGRERVRAKAEPLQERQMREHGRFLQVSVRSRLQAVVRPTELRW